MTLKTSSRIKSSQRFITRNKTWLVSLLTLIDIVVYIVLYLFILSNRRGMTRPGDPFYRQTLEELKKILILWLSSQGISTVMAVFIAIMLGVTGFNYLYKNKTVDFYLSMPKKKMEYFRDVCINSIGIYTVLSLVSYLFGIVLSGFYGVSLNAALSKTIAWGYVSNYILFLAVYGICVLAQTLCGNTFISIMMAGYLLMIELVLRFTCGLLASEYFWTEDLTIKEALGSNILPVLTSPLYNVITDEGFSLLVKNFLIAVVAFALAYISYKKYMGEFAGKAVVYKGMRYVIKISLSLLSAIGCAYIFSYFMGFDQKTAIISLIVGAFFGAVICSAICEIVFAFDIHKMLKKAWHMPVFAVLALVFIFSFKYDWYGYDDFVPELDEVEDCAIAITTGEADTQYILDEEGNFELTNAESYAQEYMHLKYTKTIRDLANMGMERKCKYKNFSDSTYVSEEADSENVVYDYDVCIIYRLKNNKIARRRIMIPSDTDVDMLNEIIGSDEYKNVSFTLDQMDTWRAAADGNNKMTFYDIENTQISDAEVDEFFAAYKKDMKSFNFTTATEELVLGEVYYSEERPVDATVYGYENEDTEAIFYQGFPVYESFSNTIEYLKKYGYYDSYSVTKPNAEDVSYIEVLKEHVVYYGGGASYDGEYQSETFYITDPVEIENALSDAVPAAGRYYTYHWHNTSGYDADYTLYIHLNGDEFNQSYEYSYRRNQVPEVVKNASQTSL